LHPVTLLEIVISGVTRWRGVRVPEAHSRWDPRMYSYVVGSYVTISFNSVYSLK